MDRFHFFEKLSFRFKNDKEKMKNETIVLKNETNVFENNPFFTTVFNKDPSLRIVNDLCKRKYIFFNRKIWGQKLFGLFLSITNHFRQQ